MIIQAHLIMSVIECQALCLVEHELYERQRTSLHLNYNKDNSLYLLNNVIEHNVLLSNNVIVNSDIR
jgi:hypothetical protein